MAEEAECSKVTIINIRRDLRQFGSVRAPPNRTGRRLIVTPICEEFISIICQIFSRIIWFMWMNLDVTRGLGLGVQTVNSWRGRLEFITEPSRLVVFDATYV